MMRAILGRRLAALLIVLALATTAAANDGGPLRLTLPKVFYAAAGLETLVYFDNLVLTETPEAYRFQVSCEVGQTESRGWSATPQGADVGDHRWSVTVQDASGKELGRAESTLRVVPADAGSDRAIRLLLIGDSLTDATLYANELARLLSTPGNPRWTMLGTHRPSRAAPGVAHEGYGGWTWQRFAAHYEPNPDGTYRRRSSPFVYLDADGQPSLDVARYLEEECDGRPPDYVTILLGINDCFSADPEDLAAMDARIDAMFVHAETLLQAIHRAAPQAELGVCLTPPPNAREEGFQANYQGRYHRWGWKRIQHRLVQRQIQHFASREEEGIHVVPLQLNLDPSSGYPVNNGVHPNELGYRQIAASLYAWLKARM